MPTEWKKTIFSDPNFDNVVAEFYLDERFLLLLDYDEGEEYISASFPSVTQLGVVENRVKLEEFMHQLRQTAALLKG